MTEVNNRRRQLIVNKVFQYRAMFYLASLVILTVVISHGLALTAAKWLNGDYTALRLAQTMNDVVPAVLSWDTLLIPALLTVLIGIVLVLYFGLRYSHRIAGPLFNLKQVMAKLGVGDLSTTMHIRSHDEFHDVENAFNQMMRDLNQRFDGLQTAVQGLPEPHRSKLQKILSEAFFHAGSPNPGAPDRQD